MNDQSADLRGTVERKTQSASNGIGSRENALLCKDIGQQSVFLTASCAADKLDGVILLNHTSFLRAQGVKARLLDSTSDSYAVTFWRLDDGQVVLERLVAPQLQHRN